MGLPQHRMIRLLAEIAYGRHSRDPGDQVHDSLAKFCATAVPRKRCSRTARYKYAGNQAVKAHLQFGQDHRHIQASDKAVLSPPSPCVYPGDSIAAAPYGRPATGAAHRHRPSQRQLLQPALQIDIPGRGHVGLLRTCTIMQTSASYRRTRRWTDSDHRDHR